MGSPERVEFEAWLADWRARMETPAMRESRVRMAETIGVTAADLRDDALRLGRVPDGLRPHALDPELRTPAIAICAAWLVGSGRWLILQGPTGIGKSVAAAWALAETGHGCWFGCAEAQQTGDPRRSREWASRWSECERARFLVVDDLGTEDAETRERLTRLLVSRDDYGRRTLLTTNVAAEAFEGYDARLVDRLRGSLRKLAGESLRGRKP